MLSIKKVECDLVNQYTVATVEVYETTLGLQRLRDTFFVTLKGVFDINSPDIQTAVYEKLAQAGYDLISVVDPTTANIQPTDTI
jgi:hypothetical protein